MNAAPLSGRSHAAIGWVAHMPPAGASAIHHKLILQALACDQVQEHPLRRW
jgi:hypothetical protein